MMPAKPARPHLAATLAISTLCFALAPLQAATYHLSPSGNDANDGLSSASAWQTLARVNQQNLEPGDQVLLQAGQTFSLSGADATNRVSNPGFESNLDTWDISSALGTVSVNTNAAHVRTGTKSLKMDGTIAAWGGVAQALPVELFSPGEQWRLQAWAKREGTANSNWRAGGIDFKKNGTNVAQATFNLNRAGTSFTLVTAVATVPADFDFVGIWFWEGDGARVHYIDDVTLTKLGSGLVLTEEDAGSALQPVLLGSYGTGARPVLQANEGTAIALENVGGIEIRDLHLSGNPAQPVQNRGFGLVTRNTRTDGTDFLSLKVENLLVEGFFTGIEWSAKHASYAGFDGITILNSTVRHGITAGIHFSHPYSESAATIDANYPFRNVTIQNCVAHNIQGDPASESGHSGHGILLAGVVDGLVENCVAHSSGANAGATSNNGSCYGIWAWDSKRLLFRSNIAYNISKGAPTYDGGGFDFDGGVRDSVLEYNYSYNNEGPGFTLAEFSTNTSSPRRNANNILRYNISQNDNRKAGMGSIHFWTASNGGISGTRVYNNTLWTSKGTSDNAALMFQSGGRPDNLKIFNNIFVVSNNGAKLLRSASQTPTNSTLKNNLWWSSGGTFTMQWAGTNHTTLAAWLSASGQPATNLAANPLLYLGGGGTSLTDPALLPTLASYRLRPGSPALNAGTSHTAEGLPEITTDFFGLPAVSGSAPEIGAAEIAPNLVLNPDFESGTTAWDDWGNSAASASSALDGSQGLRSGTAAGGRGQFLSGLVPGRDYLFSTFARLNTLGTSGYVGITFDHAGGAKTEYSFEIASVTWQPKSIVLTAPAEFTGVYVWTWKLAGSNYLDADDFFLGAYPAPPSPLTPANPNATDSAAAVLTYLDGLRHRPDARVVAGQDLGHLDEVFETGVPNIHNALYTTTGRWAAMIGGDYGSTSGGTPSYNAAQINQVLKTQWLSGGLVQLSWHFNNPWNNGNSWDKSSANLTHLVTPGQPGYTAWRAMLDEAAAVLADLRDAGVVVLWRPLHEMNGNWFWWGASTHPGNPEPYKALWRDMFDYFTNEKGLDNLLWVYSGAPSWDASIDAFYPGASYVDITGIDIYNDAVSMVYASDYTKLKALGKPMGLTEVGPNTRDGSWNTTTIINSIKTNYPDFVFWYSWHDWYVSETLQHVSLATNSGTNTLFNDLWVVTREELPAFFEPSPLEQWLAENALSSAQLTQPGPDGVPPLLHYALATTLGSGSPLTPEDLAIVEDHLTLNFLRARADLLYEILVSSDLVAWEVLSTNPGEVGQEIIVPDPLPLSENPRRFLRLRVSLP